MLNEIFKTAREDHTKLPHQIMAHRLSAEYHRHQNKILGGCATVLTTLIGTAVFTGLVSQFGLDPKSSATFNPFQDRSGHGLYSIVLFLSLFAPVVAALNSFMHHAEDAASHQVSAAGLSRVLCLLTIFLAKYHSDMPAERADEALDSYADIMKEYDEVLGRSLPLTKRAYKKADELTGMIKIPNSEELKPLHL
jgi:hypothetical protein